MKWTRYLPESLVLVLVVALEGPKWLANTNASSPLKGSGWTAQRKLAVREKTRELWYHGFDNYMKRAFPLDELTPLSCSGQGPDWAHPRNYAVNDVLGNFSLTLVDVLDTFVVLDDRVGFERAVRDVIQSVSFNVNTKPQVFETTIRMLGGLLSGHIFANQTGHPFHLPWYRGELLDLAYDLGKRLLPAFATPTGLPYARINLRHGIAKGESLQTCTAGAGSLILEFATLSRLTGDERFEKAAHKAFFGIWNRKSDIGLVGNTINTWTGAWMEPTLAGIGAGIDSFYEYALKWYILSGEVEFLDVWDDAYAAVMRYSRATDGYWYHNVNMNTGSIAYYTVDSLSAFWPGLQVLAGDIQSAIRLHLLYYNLWLNHAGLPEVYDTNFKKATSHQYPMRPEFIESTWYLYRATKDPFYLDVGEHVLHDLTTRTKVNCGLTGIQDLRTNKQDDRMESFALSETLKYLFLLFDEDNPLHSDDSNYVFTTEGHLLTLENHHLKPISSARRKMRTIDSHQCPAYSPFIKSGLVRGVRSRGDFDYARELVSRYVIESDAEAWSPDGWCEKPKVELFSYDFVLSPNGKTVPEDLSPSLLKLEIVPNGYMVHNVSGIRAHIVRRLDGSGYDIRKLGHYTVRPGQIVYVNDSELFLGGNSPDVSMQPRDLDLQLRFSVDMEQLGLDPLTAGLSADDALLNAFTATFGADLSLKPAPDQAPPRFGRREGVVVVRDPENTMGCQPFKDQVPTNSVIVVTRGECTFLEKLLNARAALAAGVLVISDHDGVITPTANAEELVEAGDISDVALVVLPHSGGEVLLELLETVESQGLGNLIMTLDPVRDFLQTTTRSTSEEEKQEKANRILYLNNHPLVNTRLLV